MSFFKFLILFISGLNSQENSLVETVGGDFKDVCAPDPCQNGCGCQASCRDELSYYCQVPDNSPFVGKNCDWEMQVNCVSGAFVIAVPEGFMHELEQKVSTGFIQFCGNSDYFCSADERCMFSLVGSFYVFDSNLKRECPWIVVNHDTDGGGFFTSGTIVWDRRNDIGIHMPRPMKRVTCSIDILPVQAEIKPTPGSGTSITEPGPPDVNMTFWKTEYGVSPAIPATLGVIHDRVSYIISEVIHVRIRPSHLSLPHVVNKLRPHDLTHEGVTLHLQTCWFERANSESDNRRWIFIENDHVVPNPIVPVKIEHVPAFYRPVFTEQDRKNNQKEALAFAFQVAIFRNGDQMEVNCNTRIEYGYHQWFDLTNRKKRDLEPEETFYEISTNRTFVGYQNGPKIVPTSENGIQSNIELVSSWNSTQISKPKNERFTHFLADRFFTVLLGAGFIFLSTSLFYVSWFYWFRKSSMGQIQLRSFNRGYATNRYSFSSPAVIHVNSIPPK